MFKLSIVVPTNKAFSSIAQPLRSILRLCDDNSDVEVILVTNGPSSNQLSQFLEDFSLTQNLNSNRRVLQCEFENANAARNLGARNARAEVVAFLDDDCFLDSLSDLKDLASQVIASPKIAGVGGGYKTVGEPRILGMAYNWITNSWLKFRENQILVGGFCLYKRRLFVEAGGFNENFSGSADEIDLNLFLISRGYLVSFTDKAAVEHRFAGSLSRFFSRAFQFGRVRFKFKEASYLKAPTAVWFELVSSRLLATRRGVFKFPVVTGLFVLFYFIILFGRMTSIVQGVPVYQRPVLD